MQAPLPISTPPPDATLKADIVLSTGLASTRSYIGQPGYPLSLLFASSVAVKRGLRVRILDFYRAPKTPDALAAHAATRPAPLWGITGNVTDRFEMFEAARVVKQACPGIFIVLGGMCASHCARQILEDIPSVDAVVCGEGEQALVELHQAVVSGGDLGAIQGLCWRDRGAVRQNPARPPTRDLDTLPAPRHDLLDLTNYFNLSSRYFPKSLQKELYGKEPVKVAELMFGRGCPFNCIFCASKNHFYGTFRIVSPERAVEQIEWFYERGYRLFVFWDDHLLLNKRWFESFSALILEKKLRFVFKMSSRIDAITEPVARRLKELGCYMICLGVEYGDDEVLRQIGKGITQDQIENAVRILVAAGIRPYAGMIINFPMETPGSIAASVRFFKRLETWWTPQNLYPHPVYIYPGTVMEKDYWLKRNPGFRWTQPYFARWNLVYTASPYVPIWENWHWTRQFYYLLRAARNERKSDVAESVLDRMFHTLNRVFLNRLDRCWVRLCGALVLLALAVTTPSQARFALGKLANGLFSRKR